MSASRVVLLGPQRFQPTLRDAVRSLGVEGPVAIVTAGWQEREREDHELRAHLECDVIDLLLYHRYDDVLLRDRDLAAGLDRRQQGLRELQSLYRLRLGPTLELARVLFRREGDGEFLIRARRSALAAVRRLDRQHAADLRGIHETFEAEWRTADRPVVARHLDQLRRTLERVSILAIAGGHVAVLLNRLRMFRIGELLGQLPVIAWSAGAMALTDRVVLFHDSPPQGAGDPEVLDEGLGLCPGAVALPDARRRLRLDDPSRVAIFARRFAPATCMVLDPRARADWDGAAWTAAPATWRLGRDGRLHRLAAS